VTPRAVTPPAPADVLDQRRLALHHTRQLVDGLQRQAVGAALAASCTRRSNLTVSTAAVLDGITDALSQARDQALAELDTLADAYQASLAELER
jgi:hypothetical protein